MTTAHEIAKTPHHLWSPAAGSACLLPVRVRVCQPSYSSWYNAARRLRYKTPEAAMAGWDVTPPGKDKDAQASHFAFNQFLSLIHI